MCGLGAPILEACTSKYSHAGTDAAIEAEFFVNEAWTSKELFLGGAKSGECKSKSFFSAEGATKVRLSTTDLDGRGYLLIKLNGAEILRDPDGIFGRDYKQSNNHHYWIDGEVKSFHLMSAVDYLVECMNRECQHGSRVYKMLLIVILKDMGVPYNGV